MMLRLMTGVLVLALTAPAAAEQPSYNYAGVGYETLELDLGGGIDIDGDGFNVYGSAEVAEHWHVAGGYSTVGLDFGIDLNRLALGGGYHTAISDTTSFFADLSWVNWEVDAGSGFGSVDDDGYGASVGLRSNISDRLELMGKVSLIDLGDGGDNTSIAGAAWYDFDGFTLGLTAEFDDDITAFGVGGRFYFDN